MLESLEPRRLMTTVTAAPFTAVESDASAVFTVTLEAPASTDVTIGYRTTNGSARAGEDFEPVRASLVIPEGAMSGSGAITLIDDGLYEPDESLGLALSVPRGVRLASKRVAATIVDDSPIPSVSIADATVLEGSKGQSTFVTANVALSNPAAQTIRVNYETQGDLTATSGSDYRPARGAVVFRPEQVTATIKLRFVGDDVAEPDESFRVMLAASRSAQAADPIAEITITNDDPGGNPNSGPLPFLSITGPTPRAEGNSGESSATPLEFIVTLAASGAASLPMDGVTVAYATMDGTATAGGGDYIASSGTLTFSAGESVKTISVFASGDDVPEQDETFSVVLTQSTSALITTGSATATISNDDDAGEPVPPAPPPPPAPLPSVSIVSTSAVTEGNLVIIDPQPIPVVPPVPDTTTLQIPVILSAAYAGTITVDYQTGVTGEGPGHADGGIDYAATTGVLSSAPGQTVKVISIAIAGDIEIELDETFTVTLTGAGNAILDGTLSVITIFNDDVP